MVLADYVNNFRNDIKSEWKNEETRPDYTILINLIIVMVVGIILFLIF